jgi:hypothetical protein
MWMIDCKGYGRKRSWRNLKLYPCICVEGLRKTTKHLSKINRSGPRFELGTPPPKKRSRSVNGNNRVRTDIIRALDYIPIVWLVIVMTLYQLMTLFSMLGNHELWIVRDLGGNVHGTGKLRTTPKYLWIIGPWVQTKYPILTESRSRK